MELLKHIAHLSRIMRDTAINNHGEPPTQAERIKAKTLLNAIYNMLLHDEAINERAIICAAYESLGEQWKL